ncbi:hypothetical protein CCACVL1_28963 [Corchorus capsularis]|uniref:F-box domain-containing protein n=1 Tax=Corchorus capsularis TaxID=210143 RepID=A0A1R3G4H8_COCAP|nr:hypothetical protein CCACVL1_28963 [Corchorus capsularis]
MADNDPSFILQRHPLDRQQLFYTDLSHDRQGNLITKKPPIPIMEMSLVDSCNGMLCMSDARGQAIYICNPFTRQSMELPKIFNFPAKLERLEFFFHSATKEYKLLHTRPLRKGEARAPTNVDPSTLVYSEVHVMTIGSPAWRNLGTIPHRFIWHSSKVIVNGRLHWLSRPNRTSPTRFLISFDLETEQFKEGKLIQETEQPTSNMMDRLPEDIILGILSKLPAISLIQSMLVCRAWRNLIQDPLLATKHFSNMVNKGSPTFIFQSNRPESSYQLFFVDFSPQSQGKVILKKLPYSSMSWYLVDSCNALLCLRDFRGIYICNPFTRRYLELPKLTNNPMEAGHIGFSFHQAANEYKVLQIVFRRSLIIRRRNVATYDLVESEVHVLTIGNPAWRNLGTMPYDFTRPMLKAMVNGKLHCLTKPNRQITASLLVSFDLANEQFQEHPLLATKHFSHMVNKGTPTFIFQSSRPELSYRLCFVDFSYHNEGNVIFKKLPDSFKSRYLVDSCNGLLCMRDSQGLYICNPFTRRYLELPKLIDYPMAVGHIGFGFHQTTNEYKVIKIISRRPLLRRRYCNISATSMSVFSTELADAESYGERQTSLALKA